MKQITLVFTVYFLRQKFGVYILKIPQEDEEWNSKQRKDTKGENPKNISDYKILYSKYSLIKSMYKIITSLFLQKSLEAYPNSRIKPNQKFLKRVSYKPETLQNIKSMLRKIHS